MKIEPLKKYLDEFRQSVIDSTLSPERKKAIVRKMELWNKAADGDADSMIELWTIFYPDTPP
jgi:hypothetical protein